MTLKRKSSKERISDEGKEEPEGGALKVKHENITIPGAQGISPGFRVSPGLGGDDVKKSEKQLKKLESELQTKSRIIDKLNEDVVNRNDAYSKLKVMYDNIKRENDELRLEKEAFLSTASETVLLQNQLNEKNVQLAEFTERNDTLAKELAQLQESLGKVDKERGVELLALTAEIENLKNQVSQYENEKLEIEQDHKSSAARVLALEDELQQV